MTRSQAVGSILIVEKDGFVYMNSFRVEAKYQDLVKLLTSLEQNSYNIGYETGKKVGRANK